jgi:hypothetical protein
VILGWDAAIGLLLGLATTVVTRWEAVVRDLAEPRRGCDDGVLRRVPVAPKVCRLLEEAEGEDLIAFYAFPREHWTKLRSTNPPERVNKEKGRRSDVVGSS